MHRRSPVLLHDPSKLARHLFKGWGLSDLPLRAPNEGLLPPYLRHHTFSPKGVAGLSFTARIGRAHSDRARSASKKDGPAAPFTSFRGRAFREQGGQSEVAPSFPQARLFYSLKDSRDCCCGHQSPVGVLP